MENAKHITLNNLLHSGTLTQHAAQFDEIVALRDKAIKDSRLKPGAQILTSCNHFVSDPNQLRRTHGEQVYHSTEVPCPVCKRPNNTMLPVFRRDLFEVLHRSDQDFDTSSPKITLQEVVEYLISTTEPTAEQQQTQETPLSKYWGTEKSYSSDGLWRILKEEESALESFFSTNFTNYLEFSDLLDKGGVRTKSRARWNSNQEILHNSLSYVLQYLELSGLASHVTEFAYIYHNYYLLLRSEFLSLSKSDPFSQSVLNNRVLKLLSQLNTVHPDSEGFLSADIEEVFAATVPMLVGLLHH